MASLPQAFANIEAWIVSLGLSANIQQDLLNFLDSMEQSIAGFDITALIEPLFDFAIAFLGAFFTIITLPFFMFYVLAGRPGLAQSVYRSLPSPWNADAQTVIRISLDSFGTYVRAEAIVAGLLGIMAFTGNMALSVLVDPAFAEVALILALIAAFSELIPNYGPWIASIPAVLFALTISPAAVVATILLYLVLMFVEGQVLVPKIEGGAFSFHPALVLFLVVAGVTLFGILGAVLALPVTAAAWRITRYAFRRSTGQPPGMATAVGLDEDGRRRSSSPTTPRPASPRARAPRRLIEAAPSRRRRSRDDRFRTASPRSPTQLPEIEPDGAPQHDHPARARRGLPVGRVRHPAAAGRRLRRDARGLPERPGPVAAGRVPGRRVRVGRRRASPSRRRCPGSRCGGPSSPTSPSPPSAAR